MEEPLESFSGEAAVGGDPTAASAHRIMRLPKQGCAERGGIGNSGSRGSVRRGCVPRVKPMEKSRQRNELSDVDIAAWVDEHTDYLLGYAAARIGDHHRAEDFVQETYLTAHEKIASYRGDAPPRAWLLGILRNKMADYFRRGTREAPLSATFADDTDLDRYFNRCGAWRTWFFRHWGGCPEEVAESKDFVATLQVCLDKLPPRMRHILVGRSLDGLDHVEACDLFGISPGNLDVVMFRARMHLRGCLEENWFKPQRQRGGA